MHSIVIGQQICIEKTARIRRAERVGMKDYVYNLWVRPRVERDSSRPRSPGPARTSKRRLLGGFGM
jgi:hypothetical protein